MISNKIIPETIIFNTYYEDCKIKDELAQSMCFLTQNKDTLHYSQEIKDDDRAEF